MAKSRKKTLGQEVVGVATMAMPAPIQKVAGSRWGARLILLLTPALFSAGIVTVNWSDGMPHLQVDRQRAQEVRQNLVNQVEAGAGIHVAQENKFSWGHPNEQSALAAPIQQIFNSGVAQPPAAAFPRLESAADAAAGFLEAPGRLLPGQNGNSQPQSHGNLLPGTRY